MSDHPDDLTFDKDKRLRWPPRDTTRDRLKATLQPWLATHEPYAGDFVGDMADAILAAGFGDVQAERDRIEQELPDAIRTLAMDCYANGDDLTPDAMLTGIWRVVRGEAS